MKKIFLATSKLTINVTACLLIFACFSSCTTYYYVVRHAEKRNDTDTSTLTDAGMQRAIDLKNYLIDKNITNVYASAYPRTQLTAKPTADAIHTNINIYHPDTTVKFSERLSRLSGSRSLVVGHSDNIEIIIRKLSGESIPLIGANDFDNLYIIKNVRQLFWTSRYFTHTTYGAQSP